MNPNANWNSPIVLLGASTRSAAESLARSGASAITIDLFGDQDNQSASLTQHVVRSAADLASTLRLYQDRTVVCCGTWPGMMDAVQQSGCRSLPSVDAWTSAQQPERLSQAAQQAGLMVPPPTTGDAVSANQLRVLRKQIDSAGGMGVRWHNANSQVDSEMARWEFQHWVPGTSLGACFLADPGGVQLIGVCRNLFSRVGDLPFVYKGSFGPVQLSSVNRHRLLSAARHIASHSGLRGLFNIDFIRRSDDQLFLLEVNPRWTAASELIERGLTQSGSIQADESLMQCSIDAMLGRTAGRMMAAESTYGSSRWIKRIVYAIDPVVFDLEMARRCTRDLGSVHDLPENGAAIPPLHPICTLIAKLPTGSSADESSDQVRQRLWWKAYRNAIRTIAGRSRV